MSGRGLNTQAGVIRLGTFASYMVDRGYMAETRRTYLRRVRYFARRLPRSLLHAGTDNLLDAMRSLRNPRTRNVYRSALVAYYRSQGRSDRQNPALGIPRVREPRLVPRPIEDAARDRYMTAARLLGGRYLAAACLFLRAGQRGSKVCASRVRDDAAHPAAGSPSPSAAASHPERRQGQRREALSPSKSSTLP